MVYQYFQHLEITIKFNRCSHTFFKSDIDRYLRKIDTHENILNPSFIYFNYLKLFQHVPQLNGQPINIFRPILYFFGLVLYSFQQVRTFSTCFCRKRTTFCPLRRLIEFRIFYSIHSITFLLYTL